MTGLALPRAAQAWCGTWNPAFAAEPKSGLESKAASMHWTANAPAACSNTVGDPWDGTDHLLLVRTPGSSPPSSPTSGTLVASLGTGATARDDFVHRSEMTFSWRLFACEDAGCTSWYADGTGADEYDNYTGDTATTETEIWVIYGTTGENDLGNGVVVDHDAYSPFAVIPPPGWGAGLSRRIVLYYSKDHGDSASGRSEIWTRRAFDTGVPSTGLNNGTFDTGVLVAQGSNDTATPAEDFQITYPWILPVELASESRFVLFARTRYEDASMTTHEQVVSVWSTDESGLNFGMGCEDGDCARTMAQDTGGTFQVEIEPDVTTGTEYLDDARTGEFARDYVADPVYNPGVDADLKLWLDAGSYQYGECENNGYDDVVEARGSWSTDHFEWEVTVEGSEPTCPVFAFEDYRISTIIPLPNGEMKAYIQEWDFSPYKVAYWNGTSWGDEADVEFLWDPGGAGGGPTQNCIANPTAFVYPDGANTREGMFFRIADTDTPFCWDGGSGTGLDAGTAVAGSLDDGNSAEIVFALLVNG